MTYEAQLLQFARSKDQAEAGADGLAPDRLVPDRVVSDRLVSDRLISDRLISDLVHTYSPLLFRVAHSILRSRPEAEDTVQDTFLRVLSQRPQLAELRDPRVWLVRITWRLALDRRRKIRPGQMDAAFTARLAAGTVPPDQAVAEAERMARVLAAIEALPAPERNALLLSGLEELETPELAAVLGRSQSATRALLSRARGRLRQRLEGKAGKEKR